MKNLFSSSILAIPIILGIATSCNELTLQPTYERQANEIGIVLNSVSITNSNDNSKAKLVAANSVSVPLPIFGNYSVSSDNIKWYNSTGSTAHKAYSTFDDSKAMDINLLGDRDKNLPVVSPYDGVVTKLGTTFPGTLNGGDFGSVLIDIGSGNYLGFMHLKNIKVKTGDKVISGQQIGQVSKVGATNNHLHTSYYNKNPKGILISQSVTFTDRPFTLKFSLVNGNQLSAPVPFGDKGNIESATYFDNTWWTSDNPKIIAVDGWGKLTAGTTKGKTIIRCKFSGQEFALSLTNK